MPMLYLGLLRAVLRTIPTPHLPISSGILKHKRPKGHFVREAESNSSEETFVSYLVLLFLKALRVTITLASI